VIEVKWNSISCSVLEDHTITSRSAVDIWIPCRRTGQQNLWICVANLSVQEAKKSALNEGAAVLVVEGTGFTEVELPVCYQILYYRGDRYELENEVHAGGGPARLVVRRRA
jgi:DNA-binding GntR family transcriptional regulator